MTVSPTNRPPGHDGAIEAVVRVDAIRVDGEVVCPLHPDERVGESGSIFECDEGHELNAPVDAQDDGV
jgi:hypothetical protein